MTVRTRKAPLLTLSGDPKWQTRGICREEDPELFFPIGTTGPAALQIEEAKAVCRRCPVMETCLVWALENSQDAGVWGGMSEDERRTMKRRAARRAKAAVGPTPQIDHAAVERALAGVPVDLTADEQYETARMLHRRGFGPASIAARTGVNERRIHRWKVAGWPEQRPGRVAA